MAKQTITSGKAPIVWSTVEDAFTKINANFTELYASIGETGSIGFDALETDLIPVDNDTYDLGAPNKRWSNLYLSDTLQIGGAAISNQGLTLDLPSGTTVGGNLIIDPNKSFFKEFSVNNDTSIVADQFNDVLDFNAGTGIQLTVTSTNDQINITNTGVTSLVAGYGMSVNSSTGVVTISNAGVRSVTAGDGMEIVDSSATGDITIHNNGVLTLSAGPSITLSNGGLPDSDGKIIITNSAPAGAAYRFITVSGEATLTAPSLAGTLTLIEGSGINITTAPASGTLNNRVTFENTGVLSLTAGAGLIVSAATGAVTVSFNNRIDIIGSVFADDSTMMIDATGNTVSGTSVTGGVVRLTGGTISTTDSSGITVVTATTFNSDVTIENELTVTGNLIVNGTTTTINSVTLTVDDKNIELGSTASPTDTTADGGGITLKGTTDKTFNYVNSTGLWTANIGIAAASFNGVAAAASTASTAASVGYMGLPQSTITTTDTLTIADAGKHIYVNTASQTITIPANSAVPYPIGTAITFVAGPSAVSVTIAITTDIMYLVGTGTTGSRTLAAYGTATAIKVSATAWYINGTGLT